MPLSFVQYTGDGSQTIFTFAFDYLSKDHLEVKVDGTPVAFTLTGPFEITTDVAPAASTVVEVRRTTPSDNLLTDFQDGSTVGEIDLDNSSLQMLYIAQESKDTADTSLNFGSLGYYDALDKQIKNVAAPTDANDAINKAHHEGVFLPQLQAEKTAAQTAATNAATSETNAATSATSAAISETNAGTSETNAATSAGNAASSETNAAASAVTASNAASDPNVVTVATDLSGPNSIGVVASNINHVTTVSQNIAAIIAASNSGIVPLTGMAATGVSFAIGEIGRITSNGIEKTNATAESTAKGTLVIATEAISAGGTGLFYILGEVDGLVGLEADTVYYLSTMDGGITTVPPNADGNVVRQIGTASSATAISFDPSPTYSIVSNSSTSAPVIVEGSTQVFKSSGAGTTLTLPAPATIDNGDLLMVFVSVDYSGADTGTITAPAGWTEVSAYERVNAGLDGIGAQGFYKFASNEDGLDYDFTESQDRASAAVLLRISGADQNDPFDVQAEDSATSGEPSASSITTNVDDVYNIVVAAFDQNKTLNTVPSGYTQQEFTDGNGADIVAAIKAQATAGASGAAAFDISSGTRWKTWHIAVKKQNATSGSSGLGPFPLESDLNGFPVKLTLPVNEARQLSDNTDAYEIFCSTSSSYTPGKEDLITHSESPYFTRTATGYIMSSPILGAYTSSNDNGPARCEFRHERNYGPTERIKFRSKFKLLAAAANSKCTCVQIHRLSGSPVIKMSIHVNGAGTAWNYRALVKKTDGGTDEDFDIGLGSEVLKSGIGFDTEVAVEIDYDPVAQTLKIWVDDVNTNPPTHSFTGVQSSGLASYMKPCGPYPNFAGDGLVTDLWTVEVTDFEVLL